MKGYHAGPAIQDEISEQTQVKLRADKARGDQNRRHQRKAVVQACPHLERRWARLPHPRYGDKVPFYAPYYVRPGQHVCAFVR